MFFADQNLKGYLRAYIIKLLKKKLENYRQADEQNAIET